MSCYNFVEVHSMKIFSAAFALAAAAFVAACSGDEETMSYEAPADVIYESSGTHEVWDRIAEAPIVGTEAMGPQLVAPVGALSRVGDAPTFEWTESEASRLPSHRSQRSRLARLWGDLVHPVAHAHNPVTGDMYRLVFSAPGVETPVRVITGATEYTPSSDAWTRMQAATGPISLELVYAYLETGLITDGPYRGPLTTLNFE